MAEDEPADEDLQAHLGDVGEGEIAEDVGPDAEEVTAEEVGSNKQLGIVKLHEILKYVFKELVGGYGGIPTLGRFLHEHAHISDVGQLALEIQHSEVIFSKIIQETDRKRVAKKTPQELKRDMINILGPTAYAATIRKLVKILKESCARAKSLGERYPSYFNPANPRTIALYYAFEHHRRAYMAGYNGLQRLLGEVSRGFNWEAYRMTDPRFYNYLYYFRSEVYKGDTRVSIVEKGLLQSIFYGNLLGVSPEEIQPLIMQGMDVVRFGHLFEEVDGGFRAIHEEVITKFISELWAPFISRIMEYQVLPEGRTPPPQFEFVPQKVEEGKEPPYFPFFTLDKNSWAAGALSGNLTLTPFSDLPCFTSQRGGALTGVWGLLGRGKTFILNSILAYSVLEKGYLVFVPINDKRNQYCYAALPCFQLEGDARRTKFLLSTLGQYGIRPQGIPSMVLNILAPWEKPLLKEHTLTKWDYFIYIRDHGRFTVDYNRILKRFKEDHDQTRPNGLICVRRFGRRAGEEIKEKRDLKVGQNMLSVFGSWRARNQTLPMRLQIDEVMDVAPAQIGMSDQFQMVKSLADVLRDHRGYAVPIDFSTQKPRDVMTDLRELVDNLLFRDLPTSLAKDQSQLETLMAMIQPRDETLKLAAKLLLTSGELYRTYLTFWYNANEHELNILQAFPPPFATERAGMDPHTYFRLYEKTTGESVIRTVEQLERDGHIITGVDGTDTPSTEAEEQGLRYSARQVTPPSLSNLSSFRSPYP